MSIYSIYDKKGCCHVSEFFLQNDASAVRAFSRLCNDSRTDFGTFPDDYALYCVGEFNTDNGNITSITPVRFIVDGSAMIKVSEANG